MGSVGRGGAISNPALTGLIGAAGISGIGDWLYLTALPILVYEATHDPALVGIAAAARLLPFLFLSMPAGLIADRFPKRPTLLLTEAVRGVSMLLIAALCALEAQVWIIIVLATGAAAAGTFSMPVQASLLPELAVDDVQLGRANALYSTLDSVGCVVGPALAGVLIVAGGMPFAFALNGLTFAVVVIALVAFGPPSDGRRPGAVAAGPRHAEAPDTTWLAIARRLAGPLALDGAISLCAGAMGVLSILIAVDLLKQGEAFSGLLNAAGGLGGIAGGIAAVWVMNRDPRWGLAAGVALASGCLALVAVVSAPVVAIMLVGVAIGAVILLDALNTTAVQRMTADGVTGRAMGLLHTLAAVWMTLGAVLSPMLAAVLGTGAALLALAAAMAMLGVPALVWGSSATRRGSPVQPMVPSAVPSPDPA